MASSSSQCSAPVPSPSFLRRPIWTSCFHVGDSITLTVSDPNPDHECVTLHIIGPGDGDWTVSLAAVGGEPGTFILASNVADAPRQILNSAAVCDGDTASIIYTVESGSGFGIDALAVFPGNG